MNIIAPLLISAVLISSAVAQAVMGPKTAQETAPNVAPTIAPSKGANIIPHRAYYSVKLKSANADSNVKDTEGRMIIELSHDCEGWTLKQESASVVDLKESPAEMMRSVYTAWESEDGKSLKFKTERVFNEKMKDQVEGFAGFTEQGGTISFNSPETKEVKMNAGTLPPISHLRKLIEMAGTGQRSSSVQVFDGSFYGNPVLIDTFIGDKKTDCKVSENKDGVYPMNLAIYAMPSTSSNPNFEIKQNMGVNGVMCGYEINFGDYTVEGKLDRFEELPNKVCEKKSK